MSGENNTGGEHRAGRGGSDRNIQISEMLSRAAETKGWSILGEPFSKEQGGMKGLLSSRV